MVVVTILKEIITKCSCEGSNVYTSFLDLSKGFERVDHNISSENLIKKKAPSFVVRIIAAIIRNSRVSVQYDRIYYRI